MGYNEGQEAANFNEHLIIPYDESQRQSRITVPKPTEKDNSQEITNVHV